jgi:hypothetical protein
VEASISSNFVPVKPGEARTSAQSDPRWTWERCSGMDPAMPNDPALAR